MAEEGRVLSVRMDAETHAALTAEAEAEHCPVAEVVRRALRTHVAGRAEEDRVLAAIAKQGDRVSAMVARTFVAADMGMRLGRLTLLATATVERDMQPEPVEFVEEVCRSAEVCAAVDLRGKGLKIIQPDDVYESALARAGGDASGE